MSNSGKGLQLIKELTKLCKTKTFNRTLEKVEIICVENGKCCAEFTVQEEHTNTQGTMHGGMSATLVDMISTFAVMTSKSGVPGVSVDLHITCLKAAKLGEKVIVEANTVRAGRTLAFLNVVIKNKDTGDIYVTGVHTKFVAV